jgi:NAD(P)-dependent dehydrogenase (short-subunit alcohol dehydrogenase family)
MEKVSKSQASQAANKLSQIVVITGASQGLGLVLANTFAVKAWKVIGTGRSARPQALHTAAEYQQFDASEPAACAKFWESIYPKSNICLVNNAGSYIANGTLDSKPEDFERQIQSVYFTSVYMTQTMAKHIPKGRIINIISSAALLNDPTEIAYGSAKAAQRHFFQTLQEEFKPEQYQITNLYPDYIATHGPNPDAIDSKDIAEFILELAESQATYYLKDVTMYPVKR